ncbi:hypothetical protein VDF76_00770 [Xanthomonas campestris pv. raphani]|uniref:hypothetical protein n=1 Tax=Xanthomonas campestris TaxID=339 RepID=UPI002B237355|nr:hypothetical protein [Xanthomonas campestris]MEA9745589.1 hypothetical protein [Xanthomonas campestris pv. raphani]MEA9846996.1 hypothetical protein [Xanthomonas campestris pv. raphani]MEA9927791.1 hypothetical protein [Xanthomonas campestris pv. raphani]MEB2230430.1 hypothetical protein [Xanthomonas campestris pv. campestris]
MTIGLAYDRHRSRVVKRAKYDERQAAKHRGSVRIQALKERDAGGLAVRRLSAPSPTALAIGSLNRNRFGVRPQVQGQWRTRAQ